MFILKNVYIKLLFNSSLHHDYMMIFDIDNLNVKHIFISYQFINNIIESFLKKKFTKNRNLIML